LDVDADPAASRRDWGWRSENLLPAVQPPERSVCDSEDNA
jgi:hypothetical protein